MEAAQGDDGASAGELHVGEALGVVDDAADGADGEHEAGDRKSTRLNSSHSGESRMPSSA